MVVYIQKTLHAKLYTMWGVWWARKRSLDCKYYPMTSALAHSSTPVPYRVAVASKRSNHHHHIIESNQTKSPHSIPSHNITSLMVQGIIPHPPAIPPPPSLFTIPQYLTTRKKHTYRPPTNRRLRANPIQTQHSCQGPPSSILPRRRLRNLHIRVLQVGPEFSRATVAFSFSFSLPPPLYSIPQLCN